MSISQLGPAHFKTQPLAGSMERGSVQTPRCTSSKKMDALQLQPSENALHSRQPRKRRGKINRKKKNDDIPTPCVTLSKNHDAAGNKRGTRHQKKKKNIVRPFRSSLNITSSGSLYRQVIDLATDGRLRSVGIFLSRWPTSGAIR